MVFDREEQREIILKLLGAISFQGNALDKMYEFKQQVLTGSIAKDEELDGNRVDSCQKIRSLK